MDDYKFKLGLSLAREEELKKKLEQVSVYDEAKERELFELNHEVPDGVYFSKEKNEYRSMNMRGFEILACEDLTPKFKGWLACAKSRARSAE